MKQVDTKAYMTALRSLTEQGHSVSVPVAGSSMSPFLAGGRDTVFFSRPDTPPVSYTHLTLPTKLEV